MNGSLEERVRSIDTTTLTPLVRKALGRERVEVIDWQCHQIHGGFEVSTSVYRFAGQGRDRKEVVPWSLILKVIHASANRNDPNDWNYLKRDLFVYQSGLVDDLPGSLAAPHCFGIAEKQDGECWIWLEDVRDEIGPQWPLARYGLAARHLGQFNGAYLTGQPVPSAFWLSSRWLRSLVAQAGPSIAHLPTVLDHPLMRRLYPADLVEGVFQLWAGRRALLDALDRLPRTFCHRDAFRRNLFARRNADGRQETVAIDWVFAGTGALGEEMVALVVATLGFREVELGKAQELEEAVFDGYLQGLGDAGWQGNPRLARFGYAASAPLRYVIGGTMNLLPIMLDESQYPWFAQMWGEPIQAYADYWSHMFRFLLSLVDVAKDLLETLYSSYFSSEALRIGRPSRTLDNNDFCTKSS